MQLLPLSFGGSVHKRRIGNVPDPFPWKAVWLRETSCTPALMYDGSGLVDQKTKSN